MSARPKLAIHAGLDEVSKAAADELVALARATDKPFHVALSGGSTPKKMFELLAARGKTAAPWERIHLWWGDERCVPPDHADSNFGMTKRALIDPLALAASNVHRIRGEDAPERAAGDYEQELVGALGAPPVFDLVLLGMGPDGHTASLFPNSAALAETKRYVVANAVDSPLTKGKATRITLTAPAFARARHTRFLAAGADKAATLAAVLDGPAGKFPSQLITGGDLVWVVDRAAAAQLGTRGED